jgi:hypothetical protein
MSRNYFEEGSDRHIRWTESEVIEKGQDVYRNMSSVEKHADGMLQCCEAVGERR